jgi:predicted aspartyl protease
MMGWRLVQCVTILGLAACSRSIVIHDWGRMPSPVPRTAIPIRDPLNGPALAVPMRARGSNGLERSVWATVDSGMTSVGLEQRILDELGIAPVPGVRAKSLDAVGRSSTLEIVRVPEIGLGGLRIQNALATTRGRTVLGQSILSQSGCWEIDWDRGLLTLSAELATKGPPLFRIAFEPRASSIHDWLELSLGGHRVKFLLDTGAQVSMVPEAVARRLKLPIQDLPYAQQFSTIAGSVAVKRMVEVELTAGGQSLGPRRFFVVDSGALEDGLLGLDFLIDYRVLVLPGKELLLYPRTSLRSETALRLERWGPLPACEHPACVSAQLMPNGDDATLSIAFERDLPGPRELTFECSDTSESATRPLTFSELLTMGRVRAGFKRVIARLPEARAAATQSINVRLAGRLWFGPRGARCRELSVLDWAPSAEASSDTRSTATLSL